VYSIETIIVSFPVMAVLGIAFALITWPLRSWAALAFGLSGPVLTANSAMLIGVNDWSPQEASQPVAALLVCGCLVELFWADRCLRLVRRWPIVEHKTGKWQFSLRSMMLSTTILAVCLAKVYFMDSQLQQVGADNGILFCRYAVGCVGVCGAILCAFILDHRGNRAVGSEDV